jgi:hypothetical protein
MKQAATPALFVFVLFVIPPVFPACSDAADDDPDRQTQFTHPPPLGPGPWGYTLTSYGGPSDGSAYLGMPACGGKRVDGNWYYATGAWSFECFSRLRLTANGKCVVVSVVDNGPAQWVESLARSYCGGTGYIIDASPLVSSYLFGTSSAGWSDCLPIQVQPVATGTPTGPCSAVAPKATSRCTAALCGSSSPVPGSSPKCYCDSACTSYDDCCPGYHEVCQ